MMSTEEQAPDSATTADSDEALIAVLRKQLKASTGPLPSYKLVAAALKSARNASNALGDIPAGSRSKVKALSKRIVELLASQAINRQQRSTWQLLVQQQWIRQHTPGIDLRTLQVGELEPEASQPRSARTIKACVELLGETQTRESLVIYEMPLPGECSADAARREKRNRNREELALRELDAVAAIEHRAARVKRQQEARAIEAAVAQTVAMLVDQVSQWDSATHAPKHLGVGDWAWQPPTNGKGPQLVRIDARYENGVVDVSPIRESATPAAASIRLSPGFASTLLTLQSRSVRHVGERVRLRHCVLNPGTDDDERMSLLSSECGLALTDLGTDLYAQTIYAPRMRPATSLRIDDTWEMRGLDGYAKGLCDLAMIKGSTALDTFDVTLFNPRTMAYDGPNLTKVPHECVCGLGFSWPLAEARAGALAVLVPTALADSQRIDEVSTVLSELIETVCECEGESTRELIRVSRNESLTTQQAANQDRACGGMLYRADDSAFGSELLQQVQLLECIDNAQDATAIAACVAQLGGAALLQDAIRSRQSTVVALQELEARVQWRWAEQSARDGQPAQTPDACLQWLRDNPGGRPRTCFSRHIVYNGDWMSDLSGETLASRCLLHGEGAPLHQLKPLATLQALYREGSGWYHPLGGINQYGYVEHLRWYDRLRENWGQQRCGGGWFYRIPSYGRALDGGPLRKTRWTKLSLRHLKIGKDSRSVVECDPGGEDERAYESASEGELRSESSCDGDSDANGESDAGGGSDGESDVGSESESESDGELSDSELREAALNCGTSALAQALGRLQLA